MKKNDPLSSFKPELAKLGLVEDEALVYLDMLQYGRQTISRLAKGTGLKRSTLYLIVDRLEEKGFAKREQEGKTKLVSAVSPGVVLSLQQEKVKSFEKILPDLTHLETVGEAGGEGGLVKTGWTGVQDLFDQILSGKKDFQMVSPNLGFMKENAKFFDRFTTNRAAAGIKAQILLPYSEEALLARMQDKTNNSETRMLPDKFSYPATQIITPTFVAYVYFEERKPASILINNAKIAELHSSSFQMLWQSARWLMDNVS